MAVRTSPCRGAVSHSSAWLDAPGPSGVAQWRLSGGSAEEEGVVVSELTYSINLE